MTDAALLPVNFTGPTGSDVHRRVVHIHIHTDVHNDVQVFPQGCPQVGVDKFPKSLTTRFPTYIALTCSDAGGVVVVTCVRTVMCSACVHRCAHESLGRYGVVHIVLHTVHDHPGGP
jgi:hypothetical protein